MSDELYIATSDMPAGGPELVNVPIQICDCGYRVWIEVLAFQNEAYYSDLPELSEFQMRSAMLHSRLCRQIP